MTGRHGPSKAQLRLSGLAFLVVLALLAWLSVALYDTDFSNAALVTLYTGSVGNEMHPGAQVMVRGVQVGEVRQVSADGSGARLLLAIQPSELPRLPANLTAEMLPTTLFGQRYVDLVLPARPSAATLASGSVIRQDRSADGIELERVLNNLLPMLAAVQPEKLSLTLTAIAQGLSGRGAELGKTLVTLNSYLRQMTPQLPELDTDIRLLAGLAKTYTQASPAILQALSDFGVTGQTIATQSSAFNALLVNITTASDDLKSFLDANSPNIIGLSANSLPTLAILARYAPEFGCTLRDLAAFVPEINKVLGAGTNQPGLHVQVIVQPSPGKYEAGKDTPVYGDNLGPHCYPVPFPGIRLNDGASQPGGGASQPRGGGASSPSPGPSSPAPAQSSPAPKVSSPAPTASSASSAASSPGRAGTAAALTVFGPDGLAGSPAETEFVAELTALALHRPPGALPAWGSLLTAPLFRGTEVTIAAGRA